MAYTQKIFHENELTVENKKLKYYLSPNLLKHNFKHGFFTKISSQINFSLLSKKIKLDHRNCVLNQIHSNRIVFGSKIEEKKRVDADGMVCNTHNQNLWIYTADCMPILFADKRKRFIAAIHCGRRGLENNIIKNLIKIFDNLGTSKEDLLVAVGPSISKKYYLLDEITAHEFYKKVNYKGQITSNESDEILLRLKTSVSFKKEDLISLDIKKNAYIQLLKENIPKANIDISRLCTYESNNEFYSWRRSKTSSRQWSFISPLEF